MADAIEPKEDWNSLSKEERLNRMRHSAAHVLAEAMVELFPDAELGIGPPIDTGFYYDFRLPRSLNEDDLQWLDARMRKSMKGKHRFVMSSISKAEAMERWKDQPFKLDLLSELEEGNVTQCTHAEFTDLCRGGHVGNTSQIGAFQLMSIAGAYWRGSEKNPQLQRVYGALFETAEELAEYEHQLEEAKRRDHRRIGKELKLYDLFENIGPGHVIWLPAGATIRRELSRWIEDLEIENGYQHVITPVVGKRELVRPFGALGPLPGFDVPGDGARWRRVLPSPDELPAPHHGVRERTPLLPGFARANCRTREHAPLGEEWPGFGHEPRPHHDAQRRAYLLRRPGDGGARSRGRAQPDGARLPERLG